MTVSNKGSGGDKPLLSFPNVLATFPALLPALARADQKAINALANVWASNSWIMSNALESKFKKFKENWPGYSKVVTLDLSKMLPGLQHEEVRNNIPGLIQGLHPQLSLCASLHRSAIMTVLPTLSDTVSPFELRLILNMSENPVVKNTYLGHGLPPVLLSKSALRGRYSVFDFSPRQVVVSGIKDRDLCWKLGYNYLTSLSFIREGCKTVNQIRSSYNFHLVNEAWQHSRLIVTSKSPSTEIRTKLRSLAAVLPVRAPRRRK